MRKLVFKPILLEDFLLSLAGPERGAVDEFFTSNPLLKDSLISFSYFEHFPKNPIRRPFDLMARCLFKGSAISLETRYPGIDLMIPLILKEGQVSFLGIQVKFTKKKYAKGEVRKTSKNMTFFKMFGKKKK